MRSISVASIAGMVERVARGFGGQGRGGLAFTGDIAGADSGPLDDPLVRRVDRFGQLGIVDAGAWASAEPVPEDDDLVAITAAAIG